MPQLNKRGTVAIVFTCVMLAFVAIGLQQLTTWRASAQSDRLRTIEVPNGEVVIVPSGPSWKLTACMAQSGLGDPGSNFQAYLSIGDWTKTVLVDHATTTNSSGHFSAAIGMAHRATLVGGSEWFFESPLPNVAMPPGGQFSFVVLLDGTARPTGTILFRCLIEEG